MFAVADRGGLLSQSASAIRSVETNRFGCRSRVASSWRGLAAFSGWPWTWTRRRGPRIPYLRLSTRPTSPLSNRLIVSSGRTMRKPDVRRMYLAAALLTQVPGGGQARAWRLDRRHTGSGTGRESPGSGVLGYGEPVPTGHR